MSKTLTNARGEYVDLVNEVVRTRTTLSGTVKFQVYNLLKSKKEVIKIQKASEVFELATDSEDVVIVFIYETAFDKVDRQTAEIWIENALSQVKYDYFKYFSVSVRISSKLSSVNFKYGLAGIVVFLFLPVCPPS